MERTSGRPDVTIGLIDGPVAVDRPELAGQHIREIGSGACTRAKSAACLHGTFVAGILSARRGTVAPAICPDCTLLVCPIFAEVTAAHEETPSATPKALADAILDCVAAGARVVNASAALAEPSTRSEHAVERALDHAAERGVIVVVAAGNQATLGSTAVTRHPWAIPVVAYDLQAKPLARSNLGSSIGRRGLGAPGQRITSIGANGRSLTLGGTSAAAPFVTGAIALLCSEFTAATAAEVKAAITRAHAPRRRTVVPPLLDAWAAYQAMRR
jgi:subtilisin family serine protease